jgi:hypothetical protein
LTRASERIGRTAADDPPSRAMTLRRRRCGDLLHGTARTDAVVSSLEACSWLSSVTAISVRRTSLGMSLVKDWCRAGRRPCRHRARSGRRCRAAGDGAAKTEWGSRIPVVVPDDGGEGRQVIEDQELDALEMRIKVDLGFDVGKIPRRLCLGGSLHDPKCNVRWRKIRSAARLIRSRTLRIPAPRRVGSPSRRRDRRRRRRDRPFCAWRSRVRRANLQALD